METKGYVTSRAEDAPDGAGGLPRRICETAIRPARLQGVEDDVSPEARAMTAAHPVRRWLARVCSAETMPHLVDPTLADMYSLVERLTWTSPIALGTSTPGSQPSRSFER